MHTLTDPQQAAALAREWRFSGRRTVLVPTMGFFHAGHESLMRRARELGDTVIVSLFVNPAQFGPGEDLAAYPRDAQRDAATAQKLGVDLLFTPDVSAMYAPDHATWVEVPELSAGLCGASRPTHFRGVCTVVAKLFMLLLPQIAVFGQKDWQQLAILRRMARDLNIPVTLEGCPIVREADGLALSSRNAYLTPEERAAAPHFQQGLLRAKGLYEAGERRTAALALAVRDYWAAHLALGQEDYLSFVHPESLAPAPDILAPAEPCLAAGALRLGRARLIDNILLANA